MTHWHRRHEIGGRHYYYSRLDGSTVRRDGNGLWAPEIRCAGSHKLAPLAMVFATAVFAMEYLDECFPLPPPAQEPPL